MKRGPFAPGGLCCPADQHYYCPRRPPLGRSPLPGFAGYRWSIASRHPAGDGAEEALPRSQDDHPHVQRPIRRVRSTVQLAKYALRDMVERGGGRVLFTSSIASTMPGSFQAVYNASKSFVQSFALALRSELKDTGVTVTSLMPGPTETEFFERADMLDTKVGASDKDDPADVARAGFEALMADKERAVAASLSTKAQGRASRLLPDGVKARMHRRMAEPGSAKK
jgi:uncharacterized protein